MIVDKDHPPNFPGEYPPHFPRTYPLADDRLGLAWREIWRQLAWEIEDGEGRWIRAHFLAEDCERWVSRAESCCLLADAAYWQLIEVRPWECDECDPGHHGVTTLCEHPSGLLNRGYRATEAQLWRGRPVWTGGVPAGEWGTRPSRGLTTSDRWQSTGSARRRPV